MEPALGQIVRYRLTEADAAGMNKRRSDSAACNAGHTGNALAEGQVFPAMVVRIWDTSPAVNLQVFLDGNDCLWVTYAVEGDEPGRWHVRYKPHGFEPLDEMRAAVGLPPHVPPHLPE